MLNNDIRIQPTAIKTLAIDLGTRTGWATQGKNGIMHGWIDFKVERGSGGGMRFVKFRQWLSELEKDKPDRVVYEMVMRHAGTDAAHVYGGFLALLTEWCESHGIPYRGLGVGTVKKAWAGKGNASKDAMIEEAHRRGFTAAFDNNEADAIAILMCGINS
jgi:Holliday junction resolvasome RuvABC endonuclease subunit